MSPPHFKLRWGLQYPGLAESLDLVLLEYLLSAGIMDIHYRAWFYVVLDIEPRALHIPSSETLSKNPGSVQKNWKRWEKRDNEFAGILLPLQLGKEFVDHMPEWTISPTQHQNTKTPGPYTLPPILEMPGLKPSPRFPCFLTAPRSEISMRKGLFFFNPIVVAAVSKWLERMAQS